MKSGPVKKFYLIKEYGDVLRASGVDPNRMSCDEIEAHLAATLTLKQALLASVEVEEVR